MDILLLIPTYGDCMEEMSPENVGMIVARFQVDELTDGHKDLIQYVADNHSRAVIFLGVSRCKCSVNNPLDYRTRKFMIEKDYPNIKILYIKDCHSNILWSNNLDDLIRKELNGDETAVLYGSRDSFIKYYSGKFPTKKLEPKRIVSGSERRKELSNEVLASGAFRHGVIWAVMNQYPKSLATVDMAVFNEDKTQILMGRKKNETKYRFPGGFLNAGEDHVTAAVRETKEETGVDYGNLEWVGSFVINDWRYRGEVDKITTTLFAGTHVSGKPEPGDDIIEIRWFPFNVHTSDELDKVSARTDCRNIKPF